MDSLMEGLNRCINKPAIFKGKKSQPVEETDFQCGAFKGKIHMVICGVDYSCDNVSWAGPPPNGHGPLDTKYAWEFMIELAKQSGAATIKTLFNEQCTLEGVKEAIREVGANCGEGDYFIFYYTGHGDLLYPEDSDQEDKDNAFCLLGENGCTDTKPASNVVRAEIWYRDNDFADDMLDAVGDDVMLLVLADCCHSGTICDFHDDSKWSDRHIRACSISGCQDQEVSSGTGKGGMFTRSITRAIETLMAQTAPGEHFPISEVYNEILHCYKTDPQLCNDQLQHITIDSITSKPSGMIWPLLPARGYKSPVDMNDFD